MKRVCAWCRADQGNVGAGREVTHTICASCLDNLLCQASVDLRFYLDTLNIPVMVVNADGVVTMTNRDACELLGKVAAAIEGERGGIVFECAYSRLPGGCGKTIHCSGCAIRRAVIETFATGKSLVNVPAYLNRNPDSPRRIDLTISTEKAGDVVLLRVDGLQPTADDQTLPTAAVADTFAEIRAADTRDG